MSSESSSNQTLEKGDVFYSSSIHHINKCICTLIWDGHIGPRVTYDVTNRWSTRTPGNWYSPPQGKGHFSIDGRQFYLSQLHETFLDITGLNTFTPSCRQAFENYLEIKGLQLCECIFRWPVNIIKYRRLISEIEAIKSFFPQQKEPT